MDFVDCTVISEFFLFYLNLNLNLPSDFSLSSNQLSIPHLWKYAMLCYVVVMVNWGDNSGSGWDSIVAVVGVCIGIVSVVVLLLLLLLLLL